MSYHSQFADTPLLMSLYLAVEDRILFELTPYKEVLGTKRSIRPGTHRYRLPVDCLLIACCLPVDCLLIAFRINSKRDFTQSGLRIWHCGVQTVVQSAGQFDVLFPV